MKKKNHSNVGESLHFQFFYFLFIVLGTEWLYVWVSHIADFYRLLFCLFNADMYILIFLAPLSELVLLFGLKKPTEKLSSLSGERTLIKLRDINNLATLRLWG